MPKPIDRLGFGPTRTATELSDGSWRIEVRPPALFDLPSQSVTLTAEQHDRYLRWVAGSLLIQHALPELTASQREILLTGLGDEDFHEFAGDDDNDEG